MKIDVSAFLPTGRNSLQGYFSNFHTNQSVILVHNVASSPEDVDFALQSGHSLSWCLCPNANLYIGGQLPPIGMFMKKGCNLVLGTDSLASNQQLSILEEIRSINNHFPEIGIDQLFRWATINGAKALQLDRLLGSFERGKQPAVILCDKQLSSSRRLL
jgi:cytosine/adenosine deaminase-related metal-dependent hydrolase